MHKCHIKINVSTDSEFKMLLTARHAYFLSAESEGSSDKPQLVQPTAEGSLEWWVNPEKCCINTAHLLFISERFLTVFACCPVEAASAWAVTDSSIIATQHDINTVESRRIYGIKLNI